MEKCNHGVVFDKEEAEKVPEGWAPRSAEQVVLGNPSSREIRKRWPRLCGKCPLGCGFEGIAYASWDHYRAGDW